ncbi:MAG: 3-phosphoshikimate 1-carboxyvinyltransferase [Actinomycetota bacterium]|nr:3-phosphoshikimate 1-carboxyvinyltransferase [Actinomycetota bacterium]
MAARKTRTTRRPLRGSVQVPGDKSISHRALLIATLARGTSTIEGLNLGADVRSTASAVEAWGAELTLDETNAVAKVEGFGWAGLSEPAEMIDCGNSGTTMRIGLGVAAGLPGLTVLGGDGSLSRRPMLRVVAPLRQMGARIDGRAHGDLAPLSVRGGDLAGIDIELPVASAQVKTALLLAGLRATGVTEVMEPAPSRDHTERMLRAAGVDVDAGATSVSVKGGQEPKAFELSVPGDPSSALYLLAAALLVPDSELTVTGVGINPTRTAAFEVLRRMGAEIEIESTGIEMGEPIGSISVSTSQLSATQVGGAEVPALIDDIPILAVIASQAEGETVFRDAAELRVKESDRIASLARGLTALGVSVEELPDGLVVRGPVRLAGGGIDPAGDHRIALSFAVAGLIADEHVRVGGWSCVDVSFPEFLDVLGRARGAK